MNKWRVVTEVDQKPEAIEFSLTDSERTQAAIGTCHLEDFRRRQNDRDQARGSGFTPGLEVICLNESDLSPEEREAFGIGAP